MTRTSPLARQAAIVAILGIFNASSVVGQDSVTSLAIIASAGVAGQTTTSGVILPGFVVAIAAEFPATSRLRVRADATALGFLAGSAASPSCVVGSVCETKRSGGGVFGASGSLIVQPFSGWPYAIAGVGTYSAPRTSDTGPATSRGVNVGLGWVLRGSATVVELRYHRVARDLGLMRGVLPLTIGVRFQERSRPAAPAR